MDKVTWTLPMEIRSLEILLLGFMVAYMLILRTSLRHGGKRYQMSWIVRDDQWDLFLGFPCSVSSFSRYHSTFP